MNQFRDPRWGRGQETYGEDPHLTARMGVEFITGLQGDDPKYLKLVATPKHYAVHSGPEADRHHLDARVSGRDLRETYLPAFRACITEARAVSIMGAYNRTNGEACNASPTLLQQILRDEWGFEGYVVSDCGAITDIYRDHHVVNTPEEAAAIAVKAGGCSTRPNVCRARVCRLRSTTVTNTSNWRCRRRASPSCCSRMPDLSTDSYRSTRASSSASP
jgi:beta-glucosidase